MYTGHDRIQQHSMIHYMADTNHFLQKIQNCSPNYSCSYRTDFHWMYIQQKRAYYCMKCIFHSQLMCILAYISLKGTDLLNMRNTKHFLESILSGTPRSTIHPQYNLSCLVFCGIRYSCHPKTLCRCFGIDQWGRANCCRLCMSWLPEKSLHYRTKNNCLH